MAAHYVCYTIAQAHVISRLRSMMLVHSGSSPQHLGAGTRQSHWTFQHTAARLLDVDESPPFPFGWEGAWQEEVAHLLSSPLWMSLPELDQATHWTIPKQKRLIQINSPFPWKVSLLFLCTMGHFQKVICGDTELIKEVCFQIVGGSEWPKFHQTDSLICDQAHWPSSLTKRYLHVLSRFCQTETLENLQIWTLVSPTPLFDRLLHWSTVSQVDIGFIHKEVDS